MSNLSEVKTETEIQQHFDALAIKWKSSFVARDQIEVFTGGLVSPGRMANLDCLGQGPSRFRLGRKVAYPVGSLIKWLMDRAEPIEEKRA